MFNLPNFCRVCLKYDKNLIDLAHIENEPNETLMSKLQLCVSEVKWTTFKPLLCHPCIKRLNIAYSFKKQCVQSAGVLKNYVELVKESQKKNESQTPEGGGDKAPGTYMLLPGNQKYVKILVGAAQNQANTYQNVFVNLIPTTTISSLPPDKKDTNQNVFLNFNNTFQKLVPVEPVVKQTSILKNNNLTVDELLTESNAEEMSVEIDPTSFLSLEHDDQASSEEEHDWDEVITKQKVESKPTNGSKEYVPILPKDDLYSGGHFLSTSPDDISCESCQKTFASVRILKQHLKQFHLGKLPFKCNYCYVEYVTRAEYEMCLARHKKDQDSQNSSLTLKDFTDNSDASDPLSVSLIAEMPADQNLEPNENGDYVCEVCKRLFNSSAGLLRHRVRKHNQKNRKKYFIKGMKNAKCDICKREFSTQSYMQLHRKLHLREENGYKYKVQGRSKYKNVGEDGEVKEELKQDSDSDDSKPDKRRKVKEEAKSNSDSSNDLDTKKDDDSDSSDSSDSDGKN